MENILANVVRYGSHQTCTYRKDAEYYQSFVRASPK